jgi:hypothetical protein
MMLPLVKKELDLAKNHRCRNFLYELYFWQRSELWYYELRQILSKWGDPKAEFNDWDALAALKNEISTANEELKAWYRNEYCCVIPQDFTVDDVVAMLEKILDGTTKRPAARLKITYPFRFYGLGTLAYFIRGEGETEWHAVGKTGGHSFYAFYDDNSESSVYLLADDTLPEPAEVKILYTECACGVCSYVQYEDKKSVFIPEKVLDVNGAVTNPENLLTEGRYYSQIGEGERLTIEKLNRPQVVENNYVVLKMKKAL